MGPRSVGRCILGATFWLTRTMGASQDLPKVQKGSPSQLPVTLLALKQVNRPDDFSLPDAASVLLVSLRDEIRSTLEASLAKAPTSASAEWLTAHLQDALGGTPEPGGEDRLGETPHVAVQRPEGHPGILLVTADYPTLCGRTTSLYMFRTDHGSWRLSWASEPGNHPEKDPGQENLEFVLSEPLPDGSFYLATCHNPPWCTSCWSALKVIIARFDSGGSFQQTSVTREMGFYRCDEKNVPHLESTKTGFVVRYQAMSSDPGLWGRQVQFRFATSIQGIRVEPMAGLRPDETVDLWKDLDPGSALQWSEQSAWAVLKPIHARLHKLFTGTFLFTRQEKGGSGRILVAFEPDEEGREGKEKRVWYFILTLREGIYRVAGVSEGPPEGFGEEQPPRGERADEED